ncbi:MAG: peptide ABC transporter substrate-binding protein [Candidatus Paceibacterota bacterium]
MNEKIKKILNKEIHVDYLDKLNGVVSYFSVFEKLIFFVFVGIFSLSAFWIAIKLNNNFLMEIPSRGGTLTEGVIGYPPFINPLLFGSEPGNDLTALVYSGLMRTDENGNLIPDLAKDYTISSDGLIYTFTLKDNIYFHDGTPVTTDDIEFTIKKAQDSTLKSTKRANWDGVTVEKINDKQIKFTLKSPYAPFTENTTLGILPKHIWGNITSDQFTFSQFNIEPIGSGPYKISKIKRTSSGLPEYYELTAFNNFALGEPYIKNIIIKFYSDEKNLIAAYERGEIESMNSVSPSNAKIFEKTGARIETSPLPRIFGLFLNQNQSPVLSYKEVRQALDMSVNREQIINEILQGYGVEDNSPIPRAVLESSTDKAKGTENNDQNIENAKTLLDKNGWKINSDGVRVKNISKKETKTLEFSISTSNSPELKTVAQILKTQYERIGAKVDVKIFEPGDLNQNVIRPRKYDALLFGEIIGRDLDLYAFWHSSQRNDPGLNIAQYVNPKIDKLLENGRLIYDKQKRLNQYKNFETEIKKDIPAIFLYSPDFIYIVPQKVKGFSIGGLAIPAERFNNVYNWYIETEKVWDIFVKNKTI